MRKPWSWDKVWMEMAKIIAQKSKDPDTQVGAVVVSPDNREHFCGYNGQPKRLNETEERWRRPEKYMRTLHAEVGAILSSNKDLDNWKIFVTLYPCYQCALAIIQKGISKVVYLEKPDRPISRYDLSDEYFKEAGVITEQYEEE